jgi:hypothetical protein
MAVVGLLGLGLLGACGSSSKSGSTFPTGQYVPADTSKGTAIFEFKTDKTWSLAGYSSGTYSTSGNTLTFETDTFCKKVSADVEKASYTWTWDGTLLKFAPKGTDKCADRVTVMSVTSKKAGT